MPFARKFRAMMDLPFDGDTFGGFDVEHVEVHDQPLGMGRYGYAARIVLRGPGGKQGVRRALRALLSAHPMTFSAYGNAYQLWCGKPQIESLGDKRYEVRFDGAGARVFLEDELSRFLAHLEASGQLVAQGDAPRRDELIETYLAGYRAQVKRRVDRYRGKLRRMERAAT